MSIDFVKIIEAAGIALLTLFAPIETTLVATVGLVAVDFVLGVIAARKRKEPITSRAMSRTVAKLGLYEFAVAIGYIVHHYFTGDIFKADSLIATMIGFTELKSILENLDSIYGSSVFQSIIDKVTSSQGPTLPPPPPPTT